jgi:hypothetical protein
MASYPAAPPNMVESVRVASERYVQEVIDTGGGLSELLTSPYAYADAGLAPLYGSRVEGALTRLDFAPSERKGYLMQVGFLASHAYAVSTDPIHRGLFVLRQLLCQTIPDPPAGASMASLPETNEPIETTREEVELLTGQVSCVNCHQHINPPGFALEGFDAAGQVRATENGVAVDTSGSMLLDGVDVAFSGALELVDALAASSEARACYAAKWLEFAYGRALSAGDLAAAQTLGSAPLSVHQLVAQVTTTSAFTHRKTNQVAP